MTNCCEKCKLVGHPDKTYYFYCSDFSCPCHTPQKCPHGVWHIGCATCFEEDDTPIAQKEEGWEKKFDEKFVIDCSQTKSPTTKCHHWKQEDDINGVKFFISSLLAKEREEKLVDVQREIALTNTGFEAGRQQVLTQLREAIENLQKNRGVVHLYDAALQDILAEISKLTT